MKGEKIRWPNGARCAVMYSFDFDGETIYPDGPEGAHWAWPRSVSYGRYGPNRGVGHILDMLARNNIKSTFFIPTRTALRYPEICKEIHRAGHEIGQHGYEHEVVFSGLPLKEQRDLISRTQDTFDHLTGETAVGFRSPTSDYNFETAELLRDLGFSYSSSMRGDDRPYRTILGGKPSDFIEIPAKWELDDYPFFVYQFYPVIPTGHDRIASYRSVLENWCMEFDGYYRYGLCYVLMLHPQISGLPGRIQMHEALIKHIRSYPDVWFATGAEIAQWWRQNN